MFDTSEYAWKDIEVVILGRPILRLLEVKYKSETDFSEIFGKGSEPLGLQEGNTTYSGELTIGQSEFEQLVQISGGRLSRLKFDIPIAYSLDGVIIKDIVRTVRITSFEKGMKQGDKAMEIKLPFKATGLSLRV